MSQKRRRAGEYLMIEKFHIENFRCFKSVDIKDLRRINIIVGNNASGKTALLEAIHLAAGATPQVMMTLNQARGVPFVMPQNPSLEAFESIWSNMFFNQDTDKTISFSTVDSSPVTRSLKIFFDRAKAFTSIPMQGDTRPSNIIPLKFERSRSGDKSVAYATVNSQGLPFIQALPPLGPVTAFFFHSLIASIQETAHFYSQLASRGKEKDIIGTLQRIFPFVEGLTVLALMAGQEGIYISQHGSSIKVPATMISAGVSKFLSLIIGMSSHRQGVVLIDEIDDGFYFKTLPEIWSIFLKLTKESEGQIFASTHSLECLKAVEVFRGDDVLSAIESGIEVR
jgi:hypothetical protein